MRVDRLSLVVLSSLVAGLLIASATAQSGTSTQGSAVPSLNCAVVGSQAVNAVLGASPVAAAPAEDDSVPACEWVMDKRFRSMKLQVWGVKELSVLGMPDARSYYEQLESGYAGQKGLSQLPEIAERAFVVQGRTGRERKKEYGSIVVLRGERVLVFDFANIPTERAVAFAAHAAGKL